MTFEIHHTRPTASAHTDDHDDLMCVAPEMPLVIPELPLEVLTAHVRLLDPESVDALSPEVATALLVHERGLLAHDNHALRAEAAIVLTRVCELPGGGWDQPAAQEILAEALIRHPGLLRAVSAIDPHAGEICGQIVNCRRSRFSSPEELATSAIDPTGSWAGEDPTL